VRHSVEVTFRVHRQRNKRLSVRISTVTVRGSELETRHCY